MAIPAASPQGFLIGDTVFVGNGTTDDTQLQTVINNAPAQSRIRIANNLKGGANVITVKKVLDIDFQGHAAKGIFFLVQGVGQGATGLTPIILPDGTVTNPPYGGSIRNGTFYSGFGTSPVIERQSTQYHVLENINIFPGSSVPVGFKEHSVRTGAFANPHLFNIARNVNVYLLNANQTAFQIYSEGVVGGNFGLNANVYDTIDIEGGANATSIGLDFNGDAAPNQTIGNAFHDLTIEGCVTGINFTNASGAEFIDGLWMETNTTDIITGANGSGGLYINHLKFPVNASSLVTTDTGHLIRFSPGKPSIDSRSGLSSADGSPIVLFAVGLGTGQLFRITADIFATAVTAGTANYTITWTENAQAKTLQVQASVVNTLGTATNLINPDQSTNITVQLTFAAFTGTVKVAAVVEQLL